LDCIKISSLLDEFEKRDELERTDVCVARGCV